MNKIPVEISRLEMFVSDDTVYAMPDRFRELDDPDISGLYVPSTEPAFNDAAKLTYWPILHIYRSRMTDRYFRIIELGHVHDPREELRNLLVEVGYTLENEGFEDIGQAMIAALRCKADYCSRQLESGDRKDVSRIMQSPLMTVTIDGMFEMYTVGIEESSTWPVPVILDKWFYRLQENGDTFETHCVYETTAWAYNGFEKLKMKFTDKFINREPFERDASYEDMGGASRNTVTPWQFCSLDDAEQFAYSLEYLMNKYGVKGHTELLHRLMTYKKNKGRCRTLFPVGCSAYASTDDELGIAYDVKARRWVLKPQRKTE